MRITKKTVLELVANMPDGEERSALITRLIATGELTETELAIVIAEEVMTRSGAYASKLNTDELLQFICSRFRGSPEYLARALVRARPDLFWHRGLALRLIFKLQADLGPVFIPPGKPGGGTVVCPTELKLDGQVTRDILVLDIEHKTRMFLWYYSRDPVAAQALIAFERKTADDYSGIVLAGVEECFARLLDMRFPGVIETLNGNIFPALHVRWWIERMREIYRVMNVGDTGTFKTSFGFVGLDHYGAKRALVLCTANARLKHAAEAARYFQGRDDRVQALTEMSGLGKFIERAETTQFNIVGWPSLASADVLEALEAVPFDALFVDECQYGKSVFGENRAIRAEAFLRLGWMKSLKRVLACSATPWENRPEELAAVASLIRPDLFPEPENYATSGLPDMPRVLRELFAENVLDVELQEVRDLVPIEPKPWEDLFGAVSIPMVPDHRRIYETLREDNKPRIAAAKTGLLIKAAIHPALVAGEYDWPADLIGRFSDWRLSSKLVWLDDYLQKHLARAKVVIGTGIFVSGITRRKNDTTIWVGDILKRRYGDRAVVVLDGDVSIGKDRDAAIERWKYDPEARILLVSMLACPDSINLTVPKAPGVEELRIVALSCGWKPWKQFLGRFWREGQGVPIKYVTPIIAGTIDEDLLEFNRDKWEIIQLFRSSAPLTDDEQRVLLAKPGTIRVREVMRTPKENVTLINNLMRGRGERGCGTLLGEPYGVSTHAEVFARHFLETQEHGTSGNIARFAAKEIRTNLALGMREAESILDAGCGTGIMERLLGQPIHGVDMNPHMITLGKSASPLGGPKMEVRNLSKLPPEWTGKFLLTFCSIVLDWTSLTADVEGVPERAHILRELVRVTHPQGQLWITFTSDSLDEEQIIAWRDTFRQNGFVITENLTGLVRSNDGPGAFSFWSLVVARDGKDLKVIEPERLQFGFEAGRMSIRRHRGPRKTVGARPDDHSYAHQSFEVLPLGKSTPIADSEAIERSVEEEIRRWCGVAASGRELGRSATLKGDKYANLNWRTLQRLVELGVVKIDAA